MRSLIRPWPPKDGDEIRFAAGILSLTVFLCSPFVGSQKTPSEGLGPALYLLALLSLPAIGLDAWWLLRTPGWQKLLALLMLIMAIGGLGGVAGPFANEWK